MIESGQNSGATHERLAVLLDEAGHLTAAPELVVEVLSPGAENDRRDRDLKLRLYSTRGVQEYRIAVRPPSGSQSLMGETPKTALCHRDDESRTSEAMPSGFGNAHQESGLEIATS